MRLWTIQPAAVLEDLERRQVLPAGPRADAWMLRAYAWLREQMSSRVPRYTGGPLWWAWAQKPDLRFERHHHRPGEWVRLELELPKDEVLLLDSEAWQYVVADSYCPRDRRAGTGTEAFDVRDAVAGERNPGDPSRYSWAFRREVYRSWQRVFPDAPDRGSPAEYVEAVFEWLRLADVRRVSRFEGVWLRKWLGPEAPGPDDLPPIERHGDAIRLGDRFRDMSDGAGEALVLRGYELENGYVSMICENELGGMTFMYASGAGFERRFERLALVEQDAS